MKKILFAGFSIVIILGIGRLIGYNLDQDVLPDTKKEVQTVTPSQTPSLTKHSRSIFVPYWTSKMAVSEKKYDAYYYFGVRPTSKGELENEVGLQNLSIVDSIPEKQKKMVLRMLDTSVIEAILQEKSTQETLISQLRSLLAKKSFSGLVLDIEVPYTLQAQKKGQITKLVQQICTEIKSDYKTCEMLIYGDFSYRNRPYDVRALGEVADSILFMAYDFHKAGGEPGPNFPFDRRSPKGEGGFDYGYDFKTMIKDVSELVPKEKIEIVFGMYGYDWTLNEQGTPLKSATAFSVNNLKQKIESSMLEVKSNTSKEKNIEYIDPEGLKHVIWYEDEESVAIKTKYLQQQGIERVSFWALSYF